MSFTKL